MLASAKVQEASHIRKLRTSAYLEFAATIISDILVGSPSSSIPHGFGRGFCSLLDSSMVSIAIIRFLRTQIRLDLGDAIFDHVLLHHSDLNCCKRMEFVEGRELDCGRSRSDPRWLFCAYHHRHQLDVLDTRFGLHFQMAGRHQDCINFTGTHRFLEVDGNKLPLRFAVLFVEILNVSVNALLDEGGDDPPMDLSRNHQRLSNFSATDNALLGITYHIGPAFHTEPQEEDHHRIVLCRMLECLHCDPPRSRQVLGHQM